ncbi:Asp23/Gls24 family envelope stress response protein [Georgenia wutianyii]|nr:Asp23/Gls24 family envelope stress response protein [Georgenia wutianyii]
MAESRLACGASYDALLNQVAERTEPVDPDHQRACPHCRAALAELSALWAPVHELVDTDVRAPSDLLTAVMAQVRQLARHSWYAVIPTGRGETRIAARIIAAVARLAAQEVPSVTLALGGGRTTLDATSSRVASPAGEPATDVGVAGTHVIIDIQIAVEMGTDIPTVVETLRAHVARTITNQLALTAAEVNVTVADVQPAEARPSPRSS